MSINEFIAVSHNFCEKLIAPIWWIVALFWLGCVAHTLITKPESRSFGYWWCVFGGSSGKTNKN